MPPSPSKPRTKRVKLSGEGDKSATIAARVAAGHYISLQDFLDDVEKASVIIIDKKQSQDGDGGEGVVPSQNRISALKKRLHGLLLQASFQRSSKVKAEPLEEDDDSQATGASLRQEREDRKALTFFGNPANPRNLFSSLQEPNEASVENGKPPEMAVAPPLPEEKLPNGITAVKTVPFNLDMDEKPVKTFGEVFAPRSTLPQLEPPRRARSWARSSSATWVDAFDAATNLRAILGEKHNYVFAPIPSVHWLQNGGATSSPSYWNRRQKHHGSSEESGDESAQSEKYAYNPHDDTALLQGAYSSFAPAYDSSYSLVQSDAKSMVWWAKKGARRFNTLLSLHNATGGQQEQPQLFELDEDTLEDAVNSFKPEEFMNDAPVCQSATEDADTKDVDQVLRELGELLETVNSYRQIRNMDTRIDSKELPDTGTPNSPSSAERLIYETLKSSLAAIISNLPPYVVSKLDGNQLANLNISQKILVETPVYSGTMEEDDFSLLQRRLAAAAPQATPSRAGSFSNSPAYNQRMFPPSGRSQQSAVPQSYYNARQPSTSIPYTPGGTPQQGFTGPRPQASPSQRASNLPGYQPGGQYAQRPTPNGYGSYSGQQGSPPTQGSPPRPYAQRPVQPGFPSNPQYSAARSASPQKPAGYSTPQPRTPYMNPGSNNPPRYYPPQQQQQQQQGPAQSANYSSAQTPSSSSQHPTSASAPSSRIAGEQASMMAQNRSQIAANQQRPSSGTPHPPLQPQQNHDQGASQGGSASPAPKQSATPTPVTT